MLDLGTPRTERVRPISAHESGPGVCMTYLTTASNPQTLVNSGEDAVLASQAGKVGLVSIMAGLNSDVGSCAPLLSCQEIADPFGRSRDSV